MKLKVQNLVLLSFIVILFSVILTVFFYKSLIIKEVNYHDMHIQVKNNVGINIDTDKLYFGGVPKGKRSAARRSFTYSNPYDFPVEISINFYGEMAPWMLYKQDETKLSSGETKTITLYAGVPLDTDYGNYTGTARFIIKRVLW